MMKKNLLFIIGLVLIISGLSVITIGQLYFEDVDLLNKKSFTLEKNEIFTKNFYIPEGKNVFIFFSSKEISFINISVFIAKDSYDANTSLISLQDRVTSYSASYNTTTSDFYYFFLQNKGDSVPVDLYTIFYRSTIDPIILLVSGILLTISGFSLLFFKKLKKVKNERSVR